MIPFGDVVELEFPNYEKYVDLIKDENLQKWKATSSLIVKGNQYNSTSDLAVDYRLEMIDFINAYLEKNNYPAVLYNEIKEPNSVEDLHKSVWVVKYETGGYVKMHDHVYDANRFQTVSVILTFEDFPQPTFMVNGKKFTDKKGWIRFHNSSEILHRTFPQNKPRTVLVADFAFKTI